MLFGNQIAKILAKDGHEIVIIRASINPHLNNFKIGPNFREIRLNASSTLLDTFNDYSRLENQLIYKEESGFLSFLIDTVTFVRSFYNLMYVSCVGKQTSF